LIEAKLKAMVGSLRIDADIEASGVTCVAGRNGAGKSSLMKIIAGFIQPSAGFVRVGGVDVTRLPVEKRGVVLVTPNSAFLHLDVESHLAWGAKIRGRRPGAGEVSKVKSELGIDFGGNVRKLSLGMRERVALATALLAAPRAILVDEVFSSIYRREEFVTSYAQFANQLGIDVVFTSQEEGDGRLAGQLYIIDGGITARSPPK